MKILLVSGLTQHLILNTIKTSFENSIKYEESNLEIKELTDDQLSGNPFSVYAAESRRADKSVLCYNFSAGCLVSNATLVICC